GPGCGPRIGLAAGTLGMSQWAVGEQVLRDTSMNLIRPLRVATPCLGLVMLSALTAGEGAKQAPVKLTRDEQAILELINKERAREKLPPVTMSPLLTQVARGHAANMAQHNSIAHVLDGKNPVHRVKEAGYKYAYYIEGDRKFPIVGENNGWSEGGLTP